MSDLVAAVRGLVATGLAEVGSGATQTQVDDAERRLGGFPLDFRAYLLTFGWIRIGGSEFFGLGEDIDHPSMLITTATERERVGGGLPSDMVPFLNNGAGDLACFRDQRHPDESGLIFWFPHETRQLEPTGTTFTEFVNERVQWALESLRTRS